MVCSGLRGASCGNAYSAGGRVPQCGVGLGLIAACLFGVSAAAGLTSVSQSGRDTWVFELSPNANYGNGPLTSGQTSNSKGEGDRRAFIAWDGISFPEGSTVTAIEIRLYQSAVAGTCSAASEFGGFAVTNSPAWDESAVTWNTQPTVGAIQSKSWPNLTGANGWKTFSFDSSSSNWSSLRDCARTGICSIRVTMPTPNGEDCSVTLHSFEGVNRPELTVTYTAPPPTPPPTPAPIGYWYQIGPAGLLPPDPSAGPEVAPGRKEAGLVGEITIDPVEANRIYIGSGLARFGQGFSGFWKTVDGGLTWKQTGDQLPSLHITEIEIAQSRNVILIGTASGFGSPDVGVYRSTDWGDTFAPVGPGSHIQILDLTQGGNRVWAATTQGLWYSDNASTEATPWFNVTWTQVSADPVLPVAAMRNVLVSPWAPAVVYASVFDGPDIGWYRSDDNGNSWDDIFANFLDESSQTLSAPSRIENEAAIGKGTTTGTDVIYAMMGGYSTACVGETKPNQDRIFRGAISASSVSWTRLGTPISCTTVADCCDDGDCQCISGQCTPSPSCEIGIARTLGLHPENSDIVVFGDELLWRSTDGGQTFIGLGRKALHADKWAVTFDPSNPSRVFVGTDGGIWRSSSEFADPQAFPTWSDELNSNLANNLLTRSGSPDIRNPLVTYSGSQDTGIFKGTKTGAWRRVIDFGDNGSVSVSPSNSSVVFTTDLGGLGMRHSLDGGGTYGNVPGAPTPLSFGYEADKLVMDASVSADRFLVTYSRSPEDPELQQVYRASGVDTATPVWSSITANAPLPELRSFDIIPSSTGGPSDFIIAGAKDGEGVWRMTSAAHTWTKHTTGLPAGASVTKIVADTQGFCNPSTCVVYAVAGLDISSGRGAFRSTNAGVSWSNISRGSGVATGEELPDIEMASLAIHPICRNVVYVATYVGVYQGTLHDGRCSTPTDGLWHWANFDQGMPLTPQIRDISAHPDVGVLRAFSWGRSAWEVKLYEPSHSMKVNGGTIGTVMAESVQVSSSDEGEHYYVTWIDDRAGANNWHLFARSFRTAPSLTALENEVQIDDPGMHVVNSAAVAAHPTGQNPYCARYAWSDDRSGENHIFMEYRCSNGFILGNDLPVDTNDYPNGGNEGTDPAITFNPGDRGFVVAWQRETTPSGTSHQIHAKFYNAFSSPIAALCASGGGTNPCLVSNPSKSAHDPVAVASLYDGDDNTFIAWSENNAEIWIRKYGPQGDALAGPVRVDLGGSFVQGVPNIAVEEPSCIGGSAAGLTCADDGDCPSSTCGAPDVIVVWQRQFAFAPSSILARRFNYSLTPSSVIAVGSPPEAPIGVKRERLPWVATDVENNVGFGWQGNVNGDSTPTTQWNGFGSVMNPGDVFEDRDFLVDLAPRFTSARDLSLARGPGRKCFNVAWHDSRDGANNVYTRIAFPPVAF